LGIRGTKADIVPDDLDLRVKAAQQAVKGVDKDLRKTAFEIVLKRLLEGVGGGESKGPQRSPESKKKLRASSPISTAPIPLDLKGGKNGPSLKDFYEKKAPTTNQEKITVFSYYITKYLAIPEILPGHIISCYNEVSEKKPLNIIQLFRDIKHRKGWIDTGEGSGSAKISIAGENLVEHDLPMSKK
jgi:hypothetical protein